MDVKCSSQVQKQQAPSLGTAELKSAMNFGFSAGALTPFVLRRASEVEHALISPCYLHGRMYCVDEIVNIYANSGVWQSVTLV
jgi:hypothetical protein